MAVGEGAAGTYVPQSVQATVKRVSVVVVATLVAIFVTIPVYVMVAIAVQALQDVFAGGDVNLLIDSVTLRNFEVLLDETATVQYFTNSLIVTVSSTSSVDSEFSNPSKFAQPAKPTATGLATRVRHLLRGRCMSEVSPWVC
jgi:hypothetical protein